MYPRKNFDAQDLLDAFGDEVVVVTIEKVDFKTGQSRDFGEPKVDWFLFVEELKKPIKLPPTAAFQIGEILKSDDTDEWVGQRVGMRPHQIEVPNPAGGKQFVWVVNFWPPANRSPVLPPKTDLTGYAGWTEAQKNRLESRLLGSSGHPSPKALAGRDAGEAPLGAEKAAKIVVALRERGLGWEDLIASCRKAGVEHLIVGFDPAECPGSLESYARTLCALNPKTQPVDDFDAEVAKLVRAWAPPAAAHTKSVDGQVVDTRTGEVVGGDMPPDDDIPF